MRIATWNVNSLNVRLPRVEEWLVDVRPDVLCLQETKMADEAFPTMAFTALGYESVHHGEGRWNGVAILSRVGLSDPLIGFGDTYEDPDARLLWATCGGVRVGSAYVPNGRSLEDDHYRYKLEWLEALHRLLTDTRSPEEPLVVTGDWNIAPRDVDVWDPARFVDATHVSRPERDAIEKLEAWGLTDAFRELHDEGGLFSWWDYRGGSFHKKQGMRIDYHLVTEPLVRGLRFATIDRNARKGKQPSDHAPVLIDVDITE